MQAIGGLDAIDEGKACPCAIQSPSPISDGHLTAGGRDCGIRDMREKMLSSSRTLSVALTRIADQPTLVLDSAERLERAVGRHDAGKTSALDIYRAMTAAKVEPKIEQKELQKERTRERSIDKEIGARERDWDFGM